MPTEAIERPSRFRLTYAMELIAIDGSGAGRNRVLNLPINPNMMSVILSPGVETTYTAGGVVIEESGFVTGEIRLSGSPGLQAKTGWKLASTNPHDPETEVTFREGKELFDALWRWMEFYWAIKRDREVVGKWLMVFHDFRLGRHWIVVPTGFEDDRNAREHRLNYPYEIRLRAVANYDAKPPGGVFGFFADVRNGFDKVNEMILDVAGYLADAEAFIAEADSAFIGSTVRVLGAVREVTSGLRGIRDGIARTATIPLRLAIAARAAMDELVLALAGLFGGNPDAAIQGDPWSPLNRQGSRALALYSSTQAAIAQMDTVIADASLWSEDLGERHASRQLLEAGEARLSDIDIAAGGDLTVGAVRPGDRYRRALRERVGATPTRRAYTGSRTYVVFDGDTVRSIAVTEVGDADAWWDIVQLNGLVNPYISAAGAPGTVRPGAEILIPTLGSRPVVLNDRDTVEELVLGVDFKLVGGDLVANGAGTGFELVRGHACYIQSLEQVKFRTLLGENLVYPEVGILAPIGEAGARDTPNAVALGVRRACLTDPRTASVNDIAITDLGDGVGVDVEVVPVTLGASLTVQKGAA